MNFRRILALSVFAVALPLATQAQISCPPGYTPQPTGPNQGTCIQNGPTSAPEISASASIGGIAVLLGGVLMLRGRKRKVALASDLAI